MLNCGDTFLTGDEDDPENYHLWIVITPPSEGEVVTVCVTTRRQKSETLVVLRSGEHPFIDRESVIAYKHSKIRTVADIESAIRNKTAKHREPATESLLKRVQNGLMDSDHTPNGIKHFYKGIRDENAAKAKE